MNNVTNTCLTSSGGKDIVLVYYRKNRPLDYIPALVETDGNNRLDVKGPTLAFVKNSNIMVIIELERHTDKRLQPRMTYDFATTFI